MFLASHKMQIVLIYLFVSFLVSSFITSHMRRCVILSRATVCPRSWTLSATHEPVIRRFVVALGDTASVWRSHFSRLWQCVIISYSRVGTEWPHASGDRAHSSIYLTNFLSVTGNQSYIFVCGKICLRQRVQNDSRTTQVYQMGNVKVNLSLYSIIQVSAMLWSCIGVEV